jgi:fatty acid desaturase
MPTELADSIADDSNLPLFAVPAEIRQWGARVRLADRNALRASVMLFETVVLYGALIVVGETIDRWWGWIIVWIGLMMCMMRVDAVHHEAVHRSLFVRRLPNDIVASLTGAIEGFHGPTYRCFHLTHHALTRRDDALTDPEGFYDEVLTRPHSIGRVRVAARGVLIVGMLIGGVSFAVQLVIGAVSTLLGRPPAFVGGASLERHVRRWGSLPFAIWMCAIAAATVTGHLDHLLCWWLVPMTLFLCGPYTFFALPEHYAAPRNNPMVTSTGSVRSNPFYRWLALDGNLHLAHHVFPNASWWRLDDADMQLRMVSNLRYTGYVAFYRSVWRDLATKTVATKTVAASTSSDNAAPVM